jgi:hypothetical protein
MNRFLLIFLLTIFGCNTGELEIIADLPKVLEEVSGTETVKNSNLIWMLNDSGNKASIYRINFEGALIKELKINANNNDWEDLTSDKEGNLYIGDFGNNHFIDKKYTILKVNSKSLKSNSLVNVKQITFTLPKNLKPKNFEAFFIYNNAFYIFSKEDKKGIVIKVPNSIGNHVAEVVSKFNLDGKHNKITSADISDDGKTVVLLNHDKIWKLTHFKKDKFFDGKIESMDFKHNSQKEGVCFKSNSSIYITDEKNHTKGGNLYSFNLFKK